MLSFVKKLLPASFQKQILLALFVVGWIPITLGLFATGILMRRNLMESESDRMTTRSEQISIELQHYFDDLESQINLLQADPLLNDANIPNQAKLRELKRVVRLNKEIQGIELHDSAYPLLTDLNPTEIHVRYPTAIPAEGGPVFRWWAKLEGVDQWIEVKTSLAGVWRLLDDVTFAQDGGVALINNSGLILSHRDKTQIHKHLPIQTLNPDNQSLPGQRWEPFFVYAHSFKSERMKSDLELQLVCFLPKAIVHSRLINQLLINAVIGLMISLLSVFLGKRLSKSLTSHINQAADVSVTVSKGDLEARIPEQGPTEIGTLARSFNEMVDTLQNHQKELEDTVAERTSNLERTTAHLQAAQNASKDGLWLVYTDECNYTLNQTLCRMFDLPEKESVNYEALLNLISKKFVEASEFMSWVTGLISAKSETKVQKWELTSEGVISIYCAPVCDAKGSAIAMLFSFTDLTDEMRLYKELERARGMEMVGHLSGSIAHEFNNLLTSVIGNLELASEDSASQGQKAALDSAHDSSHRAVELIRGMLSFSQQNWLQLSEVSVPDLIERTLNRLTKADVTNIEINCILNEGIPLIKADQEKIIDALQQVILNACQAMPHGGELSISVQHVASFEDHPNGGVEISIIDTGVGIPSEMEENLFEPFTSASPNRKGLGLAICHGIVEQHLGSIQWSSNEVGTSFRIIIPAVEKVETTSVVKDIAKVESHHAPSQRIVVVDDDDGVRLVTSMSLKKGGYHVESFDSGQPALEFISEHLADISLVVLDLRMPEMMGTEVLVEIRKFTRFIPVIICSGYLKDLDAIEDKSVKPDSTLQKPVSPALMLETAEILLR